MVRSALPVSPPSSAARALVPALDSDLSGKLTGKQEPINLGMAMATSKQLGSTDLNWVADSHYNRR